MGGFCSKFDDIDVYGNDRSPYRNDNTAYTTAERFHQQQQQHHAAATSSDQKRSSHSSSPDRRLFRGEGGAGALPEDQGDDQWRIAAAPAPGAALAAAAAAEPEEEERPLEVFRWTKAEIIGVGAFGRVFMGLNSDTGELIAIKEVSFAKDEGLHDRVAEHIRALESEVAVLKNLTHPNIVQYYGTQRNEDAIHILLEYVPGGSLASVLTRFGALNEGVIRLYTRQILRGLEFLHNKGIMHRDIKGANILVDARGTVKLADFGASKRIEDLATVGSGAKSIRGTPYWMAPEVIKQTGHGRPADIWSVGCTVIEMATGKPPWSNYAAPVAAMFQIASSKDPPPIPEFLSPEAKDFLLLCFRRVPSERANATRLLKHPFMEPLALPSNGPPVPPRAPHATPASAMATPPRHAPPLAPAPEATTPSAAQASQHRSQLTAAAAQQQQQQPLQRNSPGQRTGAPSTPPQQQQQQQQHAPLPPQAPQQLTAGASARAAPSSGGGGGAMRLPPGSSVVPEHGTMGLSLVDFNPMEEPSWMPQNLPPLSTSRMRPSASDAERAASPIAAGAPVPSTPTGGAAPSGGGGGLATVREADALPDAAPGPVSGRDSPKPLLPRAGAPGRMGPSLAESLKGPLSRGPAARSQAALAGAARAAASSAGGAPRAAAGPLAGALPDAPTAKHAQWESELWAQLEQGRQEARAARAVSAAPFGA